VGYNFILEGKNITVSEPGKQVTAFNVNGRPNRPVQYLLGITLNEAQGAVYWISSLDTQTNDSDWDIPVYPNARTVWISTIGTDTTLYPALQTLNGFTPDYDGGHAIEDIRVFDVAEWDGADGMALVADRFNRADNASSLGGSWTIDSGTWGVTSNKAYTTTAGRAVVNAGVADYFVTATIDVATVLSDSFGIILRRNSATDYTWISSEDSANIYWKSWLTTFDDFIYSTYGAFTDSSVVRIVAAVKGNEWRFWLVGGNNAIMQVNVAPPSGVDHTTGTYVGLFGDTNTRWDNFAAYPVEFALPDSFDTGAFPSIAVAGSTLISDTFTDTNGVNLTAHDTDVGSGSWAVTNGTWDIQSNQANSTPIASPENNFAYVDAGQADVEVSVDITMPAAGDEGSAGIIVRRADANNMVYARTLWQGGSNEIEIWKIEGGATEILKKCYMGSTYALSTTYNMVLSVEGDVLNVSLDGEVYATVYLPSSLSSGTGVGLYEWYSSDGVTFDNFVVKGIGVTASASYGSVTAIQNVSITGASLSASVSASYGSVVATSPNVTVNGESFTATVSSSFGTVSTGVVASGASLSASTSGSYGTVTGTAVVTGASLSATASLSPGSVLAVKNVSITGASLTATASASYGSVTTTSNASITGASLTATASLNVGSVSTGGSISVSGASLSATASGSYGSVVAVQNVVVTGASLSASVSASYGSITTIKNVSIAGASLSATASLSGGTVEAGGLVIVPGASLTATASGSFGTIRGDAIVGGASLAASASISTGSVFAQRYVVEDGVSLGAVASLQVGLAYGTGIKVGNVGVEGTYLYGVRGADASVGVPARSVGPENGAEGRGEVAVGVSTGVKTQVIGRVING
jgi:hypothetical protein